MSSRSRYVAATAAAVGGSALLARRRARLRLMAEGIRDAILPTHVEDLTTSGQLGIDESHAPGHQHLPVDAIAERKPRRLRGRPWTKHAHGMRHPFAS